MVEDHIIVGVHITNRVRNAAAVQHVLTDYGSCIKTRVGLHEIEAENNGSPNGLILIEFVGGRDGCRNMTAQLEAIEGVEIQSMVFSHS